MVTPPYYRLKGPESLKGFCVGLVTFCLQVAPAWVDVGSDWLNGGRVVQCTVMVQ